jgi:hypothetical protein
MLRERVPPQQRAYWGREESNVRTCTWAIPSGGDSSSFEAGGVRKIAVETDCSRAAGSGIDGLRTGAIRHRRRPRHWPASGKGGIKTAEGEEGRGVLSPCLFRRSVKWRLHSPRNSAETPKSGSRVDRDQSLAHCPMHRWRVTASKPQRPPHRNRSNRGVWRLSRGKACRDDGGWPHQWPLTRTASHGWRSCRSGL